jgi:hypothetical protein
MLITISKLLALLILFTFTTQAFLNNEDQVCWTKVTQRSVAPAIICSPLHKLQNGVCNGVCSGEYIDKPGSTNTCWRKCPEHFSDLFHLCLKPPVKTRKMSPLIWETPRGAGCDLGWYVDSFLGLSCIIECPSNMEEVGGGL